MVNNQPHSNETSILSILRLLLSKWRLFMVITTGCVVIAVVYLFFTVPIYKSSATILVRENESFNPLKDLSFLGKTSGFFSGGKQVEDEVEIIQSKTFIRNMIDELHLRTEVYRKKRGFYRMQYGDETLSIVHPQDFPKHVIGLFSVKVNKRSANDFRLTFKYKQPNKSTQTFSAQLTSLTKPVRTPWGDFAFVERQGKEEDSYRMKFIIRSLQTQIEQYSKILSVGTMTKSSNVIALSITSESPVWNETVLTKLIDLYHRDIVQDKHTSTAQMSHFIEERLSYVIRELSDVEQTVEDYRKKHKLANISEQSQLMLESANDYAGRIAETEIQKDLITFIENHLQKASDKELIPNNTGIENEALTQLFGSYNDQVLHYLLVANASTDDNPTVVQLQYQIRTMRANILQTIATVKQSLDITQNSLIAHNNQFLSMIEQAPSVEREYINITRQQQVKQSLYLFLLQKREENELSLATAIIPAKIVDAAYTADRPVAPRKTVILGFAVVLGILLSGLWLYIRLLFNNNSEQQTATH
ncbi:MAG: hypothetical protein LBS01_07120 [Prevotellaceae bacterium]|jgi:uncharacterized protein involved in exopolysaccharide biosynthesis|nr:hypothetical protein [Prevotellaceae bacterium]